MMVSVYCTTIMSFERYTRIGRRCQMKDCSYITKENLKYVLQIDVMILSITNVVFIILEPEKGIPMNITHFNLYFGRYRNSFYK